MGSSDRMIFSVCCALLLGCAGTQVAKVPLQELVLQPTRGEPSSVSQLLARADATVFVFWSSGCPCVLRYQARIDALAKQWSARSVAFVEVSSNAGETMASLREAVLQRSLVRPLWRDEGGRLARQLEARSTPAVVLLRGDGQVLYRGWIDNERLPGEDGREAWLEQALSAFSSGAVALKKSPTWGCTITRSLSSEVPQCHVPSPQVATPAGVTP